MFKNVPLAFNFHDATTEILIMLLGAFLLGIILSYLLFGCDHESEVRSSLRPREDADDIARHMSPLPPSAPIEAVVAAVSTPTHQTPSQIVHTHTPQKREDDLKIIEGIGPKIEELLKNSGITSWDQLGKTSASHLKSILDKSGPRFQMHDPSTWPDQAALASEGKWEELKKFQEILIGGSTHR
jgi:predicted flap endonuclease-1-like 5' DNA nuclease